MNNRIRIFRVLAEEYADKTDDEIINWMKLTEPLVSRRRFGRLYSHAVVLLTAHRLKIRELYNVNRYQEGDVSVGYNNTDGDLSQTVYGCQFMTLRNGTGVSICCSRRNT
jgi:hypothetical protein